MAGWQPIEGTMKSHLSEYLKLIEHIYYDAHRSCSVMASSRDLLTIRSRVEDEGLSFLTITLPKFCSDFERSLEHGFIDSSCFRNFKKHGRIPAFLQGIVSLVFDKETGRINDDTNNTPPSRFASFIGSIRQICLAFKKIKLKCTQEREHKAVEEFIAIERAFEMFEVLGEDSQAFSLVSSVLWGNIMGSLCLSDAVPSHGPRATAERYSSNEKYLLKRWHDRLEPYFPILGNGYPISAFEEGGLKSVSIVPFELEQPVRVVSVPKTLKNPRIIAIEPACMQYVQQGIRALLYEALETFKLTAGHINFSDQTVNQKLAIISSKSGRLATIDLSEASDRVPRDLALIMFDSNPDLRDAIDACRSTKAELPNGDIISLKKFASMGSALCFPIEAMYFYTICVVALLRTRGLPVSHGNVFKVTRDIYVYGDDILVPTHETTAVLDHLRKYNCKVNTNKTFYTGRFRESCGADAYDGYVVTPIYIRSIPPENRKQESEIISWVDTANQFFRAGYVDTSLYMFKRVERLVGKLPSVNPDSGVLGRNFHWHDNRQFRRYNRKLQRLEIRCWRPVPVFQKDRIEGYPALSKSLQKLEKLKSLSEIRDKHHLLRTARFHAVKLKREGVSALEAELSLNSI